MIPGLTKKSVIPDNSFRKQISLTFRNRLPSTHIHLQKKEILFLLLITIPLELKTETSILHVGLISIDKGVSGQEAAAQFKETVDKSMLKFKPYRVAIGKTGPVKNG